MTVITVSSGVTSTGIRVSSGSAENVLSGGTAISTVVLSGGTEVVFSGGLASKTALSGGTETVSSGGHAISTTILSGGHEIVASGGTVSATIVSGGGSQTVSSGGLATGTIVRSGSTEMVLSGGRTISSVVSTGGAEIVASGATASATTVVAGGKEVISAGGIGSGTVVSVGGSEIVASGGTATATTLNTSGTDTISAGGRASGTVIDAKAVETVSYGGVAISAVVSLGGDERVSAGGVASAVTVLSGGTEIIVSGGDASGTTVSTGGTDVVSAGGVAIATRVGAGATETLSSGGTASAPVIATGGKEIVSSGGIASDAAVSGGLLTVISGGMATGTVVTAGGSETISAGGRDIATVVSSGGTQTVLTAGVASGTTVGSGGEETVAAGGKASGTVVRSGGAELIAGKATASGAIVSSGGTLTVSGTSGASIAASVLGGGIARITAGGTASETTVGASGEDIVASAGVASGTVVQSGGTELLLSGGTVTASMIAGVEIMSGGVASTVTVGGGGSAVLFSGGVARAGTVLSGGRMVIGSGATASATTISAGAEDIVSSGGMASGSVVRSGGTELLLPGGSARSSLIAGTEIVSGGIASAATVSSGGSVILSSGGLARADAVLSGARIMVSSGGIASASAVSSGGTLVVSSGGTASGSDLLAGGRLDIASLAYQSGGTATLSGTTLTVKEGIASYTQTLTGNYAGDTFQLTSDGGALPGTLVTVATVACYARGTLILTEHGEVPVEDLRIGDRLITQSGAPRPIVWVGRRRYSAPFASGDPEILPVRISMGALGVDLPRRDLFVSPRHGMLIGDVLVAAVDLVNGVTITQPATTADVEYFHPELATHDIILAEGAPSESFIDDDSRTMFHNVAEYRALYPDAIRRPARYCRPRVEDGEALEDIRRRLAAGPLMDPEAASPALPPLGSLDVVNREKIDGWALDETRPDTPVRLRIHNNDVPVAEIAADRFRPDLNEKGIGDRSFSWTVPGGLSPMHRHVIRVRRVCDGAELPGSPWVLEPEEPLPPAALPTPGIECAGGVDSVTRERLTGWARDEDDPANPVALSIFDNGMVIARVLANRYRFDLRAAGIGEGRHSFDVTIPGGLTPLRRHVISIKRDRDGAELHGSPIVIDAASTFDAALERSLADAVTALGSSGAEAARVLEFMAGQMSRLCDLRAGVDARREARHAAREFHRRWGPGADGAGPPPRALVIDDRIPIPGRDAGSNVVLSHMRALRCLGYEVGLAAAEAPAPVGSAPTALADAGIGFFGEPFYASIEDVLRRQTRCFDVIYLHRAGIAERYLALARTYCPDARIIYSIADLHHLRLARQAEVEGRPELAAASRRMRITEKVAALSADAVITHSPVEMALLREDVPQAAIYQVPWSVPARPSGVPVAERSGVAFIGGYGHAPNVDAAWWLVREVMPLVWRVHPSIGCLLVGTDMPPAIRGLAGPGVRVAGAVGDLAADVFRRVRLTVAPLRFGAGIKGKVLDSFAAGVPCAMSEIAAEGLDLPPVLRSLTAADAATLAAIMLRLHDDEIANEEAARAGLALIERDFSDDATVAALGVAIGVAVPAAVKQAEPTNA